MSDSPLGPILGLGLEQVIRDMPSAVVVVEAESGQILHANEQGRAQTARLGRAVPTELTPDWEIFRPDGRAYRMEEWPLVRSLRWGEKVLGEEYFHKLPDGGRLFIRSSSWPIHDDEGRIVAGVLVMDDMYEEKQAAHAIEEAEQRSETILESITETFLALDRDWRITDLNGTAVARLGAVQGEALTREALLGTSLWEAVPDAVGTATEDALRSALRDQSSVEFERYSEPTDTWWATTAYPADGGLVLYSREITARKRRERELAYHGSLLDVIEDAVVGSDAAFNVTAWNTGAERLYGYTAEEVLGRPAREVASYEGDPSRLELEGELLEDGRTRTELSAVRKDGTTIEVELISVAVRGEGGEITGYVGIHRDMTDRKRLEETLAEVRQTERRRLARALHDEALQELTDAIVLLQGPPDSPKRRASDQLVFLLRRVGQQLRSAIYELRLEEQEGQPFRHLLEALVSLHATMAVGCEVKLELRDGVPAGPLGNHGTEVLRLIGEALTNARRHSGASHIRVTAWGSEDQVCIEVADDGRGLAPPEKLADTTRSGIAGMRERAELLDADLDIRIRPGEGTTVRVGLPLPGTSPRKARVLLVEDHAAVREALAAVLERAPDIDAVVQAGTLAEARGMLEDIDVAIVDLGLPDGYGGDLIGELTSLNPRAGALVLSATLDREATARAIESGAVGVVDKISPLEEIVEAVRRLRAGETLIPLDEVVELLRFAGRRREEEQQDRAAIASLTPREVEVLHALAKGLDSQGVADLLHISLRTERNHVASILGKLGVHSQLQALVFALRHGVVQVR